MWVLLVNVVGGLLKLCVGLMNVRVRKINVVGVRGWMVYYTNSFIYQILCKSWSEYILFKVF